MTRQMVAVGVVAAIGLTGCVRTVYRTAAAPSPSSQAQICAGLNELDATFAAVPAISRSTTRDQLKTLRDDIARSSEKVTSERGRYNETARTDLAGARQDFLLAVDGSGSATSAIGSASSFINDTYKGVKGSMAAVRYSTDCSSVPG